MAASAGLIHAKEWKSLQQTGVPFCEVLKAEQVTRERSFPPLKEDLISMEILATWLQQ